MHFIRQLNCWSLRCSWSIACRHCSNYIFIPNLTPGFNGLGKENYNMRREAFKFWDLVCLILETLRYMYYQCISSGDIAFFYRIISQALGHMYALLGQWVNSLAPGKFKWNFRYLIFQIISVIDGWGISCVLALRWMSLNFTDDKSTLVQVMAWYVPSVKWKE